MYPISGIDLCKMIREQDHFADIPIIFLSASEDQAILSKIGEFGLVDYIKKPFSLEELIRRIKIFLPDLPLVGMRKN
ncbi:MAG: hypothetical protein A2161_18845 [Candidatus Schekmanbacteria bacterium RBG_13_48_7]|uniref:Response regulatory domain-containing protein n=1 Tax=Candidatus Schekmanbacteria bacterium RBG_13_48_7 TaxID=1817878 RepID=A0A1F7RW40_9BACT|nr:MAG: hypothetical protein A2161_18845 [Candidatus Schekmanbacteria bacterium RBG_13_48_7]